MGIGSPRPEGQHDHPSRPARHRPFGPNPYHLFQTINRFCYSIFLLVKLGYPPKPLLLIPELPIASLDIKRGEQIIVVQTSSSSTPTASTFPPVPAPSRPNPVASTEPKPAPSATAAAPEPQHRPSAPKSAPPPTAGREGPETVETPSGTLVHRVVPDDNSCLFSAVGIVFLQDMAHAQGLRQGPSTFHPPQRSGSVNG